MSPLSRETAFPIDVLPRAFPAPLPDDAATAADVTALTGGSDVELVWRNGFGGLTFRYRSAGGARFFTWVPADHGGTLRGARLRADWVRPYVCVPEFDEVAAAFGGWWTTSASLPGVSAVDPVNLERPRQAVEAIAHGLRRLHDAAPTRLCPFTWEVQLEAARRTLRAVPDWRAAPDGYFADMTDAEAQSILSSQIDREPDLVVCHGDACSPNTIVRGDGAFAGLVDVGGLGVGDRWADLAVASWSLGWNFGPGWEDVFFDAYGTGKDLAKIVFYRLLWQLEGS
jgi:kanamycin kinase